MADRRQDAGLPSARTLAGAACGGVILALVLSALSFALQLRAKGAHFPHYATATRTGRLAFLLVLLAFGCAAAARAPVLRAWERRAAVASIWILALGGVGLSVVGIVEISRSSQSLADAFRPYAWLGLAQTIAYSVPVLVLLAAPLRRNDALTAAAAAALGALVTGFYGLSLSIGGKAQGWQSLATVLAVLALGAAVSAWSDRRAQA